MENFKKNSFDPDEEKEKSYLQVAKDSFWRVWKSRFLWFWGIFLPSSFSLGLSLGSNEEGASDWSAIDQNRANSLISFAVFNWFWVLMGMFAILAFLIFLWIFSAISRKGVTRILDQIQNKKKKKFRFSDVWKEGKFGIKAIVELDLVLFLFVFLLFLILASPIIFLFASQKEDGALFLLPLAFVIFFPIAILTVFIRNIAVIYIAMINEKVWNSIEKSYFLVTQNLRESGKLFLVSFFLGLIKFGVYIMALSLLFVFFLGTAFFFHLFVTSEELSIAISLVILSPIILVVFLLVRSIFSLWTQDIWLWWVKKIDGVKAKALQEKEKERIPKAAEPAIGMKEKI